MLNEHLTASNWDPQKKLGVSSFNQEISFFEPSIRGFPIANKYSNRNVIASWIPKRHRGPNPRSAERFARKTPRLTAWGNPSKNQQDGHYGFHIQSVGPTNVQKCSRSLVPDVPTNCKTQPLLVYKMLHILNTKLEIQPSISARTNPALNVWSSLYIDSTDQVVH